MVLIIIIKNFSANSVPAVLHLDTVVCMSQELNENPSCARGVVDSIPWHPLPRTRFSIFGGQRLVDKSGPTVLFNEWRIERVLKIDFFHFVCPPPGHRARRGEDVKTMWITLIV